MRDQCLEPLRLTVSEAARGLGVTRKTFSELVNGRSGVSPEMALRLAKAFGGTPETWLTLQLHYDLAKARIKAQDMVVRRFTEPSEA
ncbi:HigA family addiction module antitoxin [Desulfolutivibrio sp.]|uniref:HigA family addiction module antitoxin n=1 Tax=Desulfolutivibrio sp. TaxID=2773296 RepID=UPI002F96DB4A